MFTPHLVLFNFQSLILISFQYYLPCSGTKEQFFLTQIVMLYKAINANLMILLVKIHIPQTQSRNEEKFSDYTVFVLLRCTCKMETNNITKMV